jgi:hypothetical protein
MLIVPFLLSLLVAACSDSARPSAHAATDAGGQRDGAITGPRLDAGQLDAGALPSGQNCGDKPRRLVNFYDLPEIPAGALGATSGASIVLNDRYLYFMLNIDILPNDAGVPIGQDNDVRRIPKSGGESVLMASNAGASEMAYGFAATNTVVVFTRSPQVDGGTKAEIVRVPAEGGDAVVLAEAHEGAAGLAADDENVYFADHEATKSVPLSGGEVRMIGPPVTEPRDSLALIDQTLYIADVDRGTMYSVPAAGGKVTTVVTTVGGWAPIACGPNLCWLDAVPLGGNLMQLAPGGTPFPLVQGLLKAHSLIFDGSNFFLVEDTFPERLPASNDAIIALGPPDVGYLAWDDECLYWSTHFGIYNVSRAVADAAEGELRSPGDLESRQTRQWTQ